MPYALVRDETGEVLQIGPGMYPGNIPAGVTPYDVGEDVVAGMIRDEDGSFANPSPAQESETPERLKAYAATKRYQCEAAGIVVAGVPIATDRQSQILINGALNYSALNPNATLSFKARDGSFIPMDGAALQALALAVSAQIQACFAKEAQVVDQIEAGTIDSRAAIDIAFSNIAAP